MLWSWDHGPDWLCDLIAKATCWLWGHQPTMDHCGLPDHDSCTWCRKVMPYSVDRGGNIEDM